MRQAAGSDPTGTVAARDPSGTVAAAAAYLTRPGLVVLAGPAGIGRSSALRQLAEAFRGPVFAGGGLAMLRDTPALALSRAVRVRLPTHDAALLAEAVRSRVRGGLLVIDDLQWADPLTVAALALLAEHCRVLAALATPHRLPAATERDLRAAAVAWLPVPPLSAAAATELARRLAPAATDEELAWLVSRCGGLPLAVSTLARHLAARAAVRHGPTSAAATTGDLDDTAYRLTPVGVPAAGVDDLREVVAAALADLTRPARTAIAALGLLGQPAPAGLLPETAVAELVATGLVVCHDDTVGPVSPYLAQVAAGLLDPGQRAGLHRRLAALVPPGQAARHLAAAGDTAQAYRVAVAAAAAVTTTGERADLLLAACALPGVGPDRAARLAAARAALAAGRPRACLRVLRDVALTGDPAAAVLRGEALLQVGDPAGAIDAVGPVLTAGRPAGPSPTAGHGPAGGDDVAAAAHRVRLLGLLAVDPQRAAGVLAEVTARFGEPPDDPGLRAAVAAIRAATRVPGWQQALAGAAAAAGAGGDPLAARWSAWLLVETLAADGRLADAQRAAHAAAQACAADLAYSWQTRFLAAALWCAALRGGDTDDVVRRAADLTDRTLPAVARGYAAAAISLAEADAGLLASARARLTRLGATPAPAAATVAWVAQEAAWLDGQPEQAVGADPRLIVSPLLDGLRRITARWAAYDASVAADVGGDPAGPAVAGASPPSAPGSPDDSTRLPTPVRQTLTAWATRDPDRFAAAAAAWHDLARREEVRCLLAYGLVSADAAGAVPPLLRAEQLAAEAGLVVLLGRTRRALRRYAVRRDNRGRRAGDDLTERERAVLGLVARGEPTRRIASQLGISAQTVETHIRSGMRKLGARTRTEAAALALPELR